MLIGVSGLYIYNPILFFNFIFFFIDFSIPDSQDIHTKPAVWNFEDFGNAAQPKAYRFGNNGISRHVFIYYHLAMVYLPVKDIQR